MTKNKTQSATYKQQDFAAELQLLQDYKPKIDILNEIELTELGHLFNKLDNKLSQITPEQVEQNRQTLAAVREEMMQVLVRIKEYQQDLKHELDKMPAEVANKPNKAAQLYASNSAPATPKTTAAPNKDVLEEV
ncbi:MAG: hypothetical protein AAF153_00105 [Pseudomonadota bacterium]